jgi:hypothetical protein
LRSLLAVAVQRSWEREPRGGGRRLQRPRSRG